MSALRPTMLLLVLVLFMYVILSVIMYYNNLIMGGLPSHTEGK